MESLDRRLRIALTLLVDEIRASVAHLVAEGHRPRRRAARRAEPTPASTATAAPPVDIAPAPRLSAEVEPAAPTSGYYEVGDDIYVVGATSVWLVQRGPTEPALARPLRCAALPRRAKLRVEAPPYAYVPRYCWD